MEKKLFYTLGLFIVGMCIASCGDDDDNSGNTADRGGSATTVDGKRLMQMIEDDDTVSLEYNSEGKIVILSYGNDGKTKEYYSYSDNQIIVSSSYSSSSNTTYSLENGRITKKISSYSYGSSSSNAVYNYEYDSEGHLIAIRYSNNSSTPATYEHGTSSEYSTTENTIFTWQNGNMVKSVEEYVSTTTTKSWTSSTSSSYPYTTTWTPKTETSTSKSTTVKEYTYTNYDNVLPLFSDEVDEVLRWQGYFGKSSNNLPQKMERTTTSSTGSSNTRIYTYDYTFTGNVVTKMIETKTGSSTGVNKYTFTWE